MAGRYFLISVLSLLALTTTALAQASLVSNNTTGKDIPVEVSADQALEWQRDKKLYIARGKAEVKRGDMTLFADVLTAYYREGPNGGTDIWKLTADQDVRIITPTQKVFGDKGVYDLDRQIMTLTGQNLRLEAAQDTITATDSLEYQGLEKQAIARGNAVATRAANRIRADVLEAHFQENAEGQLDLVAVHAIGNVAIVTPTDVLRGQKGRYDVRGQMATLDGDVKITRGDNQLNGEKAEVNLATGVSRMLASSTPVAPGTGRVRGLFSPNQAPKLPQKTPAKP